MISLIELSKKNFPLNSICYGQEIFDKFTIVVPQYSIATLSDEDDATYEIVDEVEVDVDITDITETEVAEMDAPPTKGMANPLLLNQDEDYYKIKYLDSINVCISKIGIQAKPDTTFIILFLDESSNKTFRKTFRMNKSGILEFENTAILNVVTTGKRTIDDSSPIIIDYEIKHIGQNVYEADESNTDIISIDYRTPADIIISTLS